MLSKSVEQVMFYNALPSIFEKAKELRANMTEAEKVLWRRLKNKKLGVRFKAQHPIDIFIADFYCHQAKLVIEVDGEIHKQQKQYDEGRTADLERLGIRVIRFTNREVLQQLDAVVDQIKQAISTPKSPEGDF